MKYKGGFHNETMSKSGKIAMLTNVVSPHMLPLAASIANRVGFNNFSYLAIDHISELRKKIGWSDRSEFNWVKVKKEKEDYQDFLKNEGVEDVEILLLNIRDSQLIHRRTEKGLTTYFSFERWFRPPYGMLRLLHPKFCAMAYRYARELLSGHFIALPIGVHAARDMARLCGLVAGDWRCLFSAPPVAFERHAGGKITLSNGGAGEKYGLPHMRMWAYFVNGGLLHDSVGELRVMWVGRYLPCKHVEVIVDACVRAGLSIDLFGIGPEEGNLKKKYLNNVKVKFNPPLSAQEVRLQMQKHAIYVFASDASDGWGVVVNESLIEGMAVVGTSDAGAPPTLIEDGVNGLLFKAGDIARLRMCLEKLVDSEFRKQISRNAQCAMRERWMPETAADFLISNSFHASRE